MASQQKLLNADRLQTVLFSTRFVTWERENEFAIFMLYELVSQRDQPIKNKIDEN